MTPRMKRLVLAAAAAAVSTIAAQAGPDRGGVR